MSNRTYEEWCKISNSVRSNGNKVFECSSSSRYELEGYGSVLVEDAGYSETVMYDGCRVLLNHGNKTVKVLSDSNVETKSCYSNITSKLDSDIMATETIITSLSGNIENNNDIQFYTGRLTYMRELKSHIAYLNKRKEG